MTVADAAATRSRPRAPGNARRRSRGTGVDRVQRVSEIRGEGVTERPREEHLSVRVAPYGYGAAEGPSGGASRPRDLRPLRLPRSPRVRGADGSDIRVPPRAEPPDRLPATPGCRPVSLLRGGRLRAAKRRLRLHRPAVVRPQGRAREDPGGAMGVCG